MMGACFGVDLPGHELPGRAAGHRPGPDRGGNGHQPAHPPAGRRGQPYHYLVQISTALLLVLAANTAFADFPRLASILARDRFLPRVFQFRGDRLAFTSGIVVLAVVAARLIVVFEGSVTNLIPLYTVGVFVAFTLSQSGMVRHWWKLRDEEPGWRWRAAINGLGAVTTGIVAIVVAISKFALGAWMVLMLIPVLIGMMWAIRQHYTRLEGARRAETPVVPERDRHPRGRAGRRAGVPARQALAFARAMAADDDHVVAVHVTDDVASADDLRRQWEDWEPRRRAGHHRVAVPLADRAAAGLHRRAQGQQPARHHHRRAAGVRAGALVGAPAAQPDRAAPQGGAAVPPGRGGRERAVPHGQQHGESRRRVRTSGSRAPSRTLPEESIAQVRHTT